MEDQKIKEAIEVLKKYNPRLGYTSMSVTDVIHFLEKKIEEMEE